MSDENGKIDVLDSNYPLMTLLREKAPGTLAHSKDVAALLEVLGAELNLDVPNLKIAGYYHDIGKTVNADYFSENQTSGENGLAKHDPWISFRIITAHVGDTTQILINDENIAREVIVWCSQHHGSGIVKYFYEKSGAKNADTFRYRCSKPSSLEAGLLMICDQIEAISKSMSQAGKLTDVDSFVEKTINSMMSDEQLDDVPIPKLGFLRQIKDILKRELRSKFHKRVDYDKAKEEIPAEPIPAATNDSIEENIQNG